MLQLMRVLVLKMLNSVVQGADQSNTYYSVTQHPLNYCLDCNDHKER